MKFSTISRNHAVVVGGSIAGLITAAVLTKHFKKVTLIDGDTLGSNLEARKATPQGHHVHGLLSSGWEAVKEIFPGIDKELMDQGAHWVHFGNEFRWHHFGKVKAQFDEPMYGPFMSRACLEAALYKRVSSFENLEVMQQCKVAKIFGAADNIEGIKTDKGDEILADLLIDASGRRSNTAKGLEELGVKPIRKKTLAAGLRYCSFRFIPSPDFEHTWKALFVTPKPPVTKAAAIFPIADGQWLVTVSGRENDVMPTNLQEFIEYTEQLHTPEVREALEGAKAVSTLKHFRYKESRHFCYEEADMPKNLVVLGDAYCSFNPIFGQGMTVCALEAKALDTELFKRSFDSNVFYKSVSKIVGQAWDMITVEDMRHKYLHEKVPFKIKLRQWISAKVYDKTSEDPVLNKMLYEVIHFTRPASDLRTFSVLWKVLR